MNIRTKILSPSLLAIATMTLLGIVGHLGVTSTQRTLDLVAHTVMQHTALLNESRGKLLAANIDAYRLFAWMETLDEARVKKDTEAILAHADSAIQVLKSMSERNDLLEVEKQALSELAEPVAKYRKTVAQAIDLAQSDIPSGAAMMKGADKRFIEIDDRLNSMIEEQKTLADTMIGAEIARAANTTAINVALFLVGLIGAMAFSLVFSGKIVKAMLDAIQTARSIAGGNLTNTIDAKGHDETADLLRSLDSMQENLRELIGQIASNAHKTASTCSALSGALNEISQSVTGQNDATSAVAAAVEKMSVSISTLHENANHSLHASQKSSELASNGVVVIQNVVDEMIRFADSVGSAASVIDRVGQQSGEISTIINVIREVTDQTNLLSLNAAIEAARAGEAGRGFAVVADEVRKLAEKTSASAAEITRVISAIQTSSSQAVSNIHHVVEQVRTTAAAAGNARESINDIHISAEQSTGFAHEISAALGEQSHASTLIATKVESITQMSEKNAHGVNKADQAMRELDKESRVLKAAVERFTV